MKDLKRIVIIGATGFIGTNLCERLNFDSLSWLGISRGGAREPSLSKRHVILDYRNSDELAAILEPGDVIVHLANSSIPSTANIDKIRDIESNLIPTVALLDVCLAVGVKKIVFVSSGGTVYGNQRKTPISEAASLLPKTSYAITKISSEMYLNLYKTLYNLECCVLRVANPYGKHQLPIKGQGVLAHIFKSLYENTTFRIWGDGSVIRDYIDVSDVVECIFKAIFYEGDETTFNVGSGVGVSLNDLVEQVKVNLGKNLSVEYEEGRSLDVSKNILDVRLAKEELCWAPRVDLSSGIRSYDQWFRENFV